MDRLKIIAFTHKNTPVDKIGQFHLNDEEIANRLTHLKNSCDLHELMYLSTCNRVEFLFTNQQLIDKEFLKQFFTAFAPHFNNEEINHAVQDALVFKGSAAIRHLFEVSSSMDSLVVGEREIITQVRNAYDKCNALGLTGDTTRLAVKFAVTTAKEVYTKTEIANKPVSIVSLAYRKLIEAGIKPDARFIIIGAGQTNTLMAKFLVKHKFGNFSVFNRTLTNAEVLAKELNGEAHGLNELKTYQKGFDVLITCTASNEYIVDNSIYNSLLNGDKNQKIVIDLSIPNDIDPEVIQNNAIKLIDIKYLQEVANENLLARKKELHLCDRIIEDKLAEYKAAFKLRQVELAMQEVPEKVKEIRANAIENVFARDIENMDIQSKEVLDKILNYVEKKYISVPMKMAKEIIIDKIA